MATAALTEVFHSIQRSLFAALEEELGELRLSHRRVVEAFELLELPGGTRGLWRDGYRGRPRHNRLALLKAFIAKAVLGMSCTRSFLDRLGCDPTLRRLCGWEARGAIPSESTFSRAFAEYAQGGLPGRLHRRLARRYAQDRQARQVSYDSTDIPAREKPRTQPPAPGLPDLKAQYCNTLADNLLHVPGECDIGVKRKAHAYHWRGYKLHLGVTDGDLPLAAIVSSASVHDSQLAIPLMQQVHRTGLKWFADLADAAYACGHHPRLQPPAVPATGHRPQPPARREGPLRVVRAAALPTPRLRRARLRQAQGSLRLRQNLGAGDRQGHRPPRLRAPGALQPPDRPIPAIASPASHCPDNPHARHASLGTTLPKSAPQTPNTPPL